MPNINQLKLFSVKETLILEMLISKNHMQPNIHH